MLRTISRYLLGLLFVGAGGMHFLMPDSYLKIMPPYMPFPRALIAISGFAEIAGGLGVLLPPTRRLAGYGLMALLIAVFPTNINMALQGTESVGWNVPRGLWWARLPLQALFIWWVWFAAVQKEEI
jgi:uncharacterized membrane protein